jgi:dipeptidyl aminopeptidase/acylaminoacyl peptidase
MFASVRLLGASARVLPLGAVLASMLVSLVLVAPAQAAFPGANGKIVFMHSNQVSVINPDGSALTYLPTSDLEDPNSFVGFDDPAWSPDGTKIAFAAFTTFGPSIAGTDSAVWTMNADGSDKRLLTTQVRGRDPSWSPDGTKIAFVSDRLISTTVAIPELYVMNADGSGQTKLAEHIADPVWSPDGDRIAVATPFDIGLGGLSDATSVSSSEGISTISSTGGPLTRITNVSGDRNPDWSPDGSKLVFERLTPTALSNERQYVINVVNADGAGLVQIGAPPVRLINQIQPVWSPDGKRVAFVLSDNFRIYTMAADGSDISQVTPGPNDTSPDWQRVVLPTDSDSDGITDASDNCPRLRTLASSTPTAMGSGMPVTQRHFRDQSAATTRTPRSSAKQNVLSWETRPSPTSTRSRTMRRTPTGGVSAAITSSTRSLPYSGSRNRMTRWSP